jgi:hypothetical protein
MHVCQRSCDSLAAYIHIFFYGGCSVFTKTDCTTKILESNLSLTAESVLQNTFIEITKSKRIEEEREKNKGKN